MVLKEGNMSGREGELRGKENKKRGGEGWYNSGYDVFYLFFMCTFKVLLKTTLYLNFYLCLCF